MNTHAFRCHTCGATIPPSAQFNEDLKSGRHYCATHWTPTTPAPSPEALRVIAAMSKERDYAAMVAVARKALSRAPKAEPVRQTRRKPRAAQEALL